MRNSVARTQPTRRYDFIPSENNLPLAIGANFHDDPICRDTCRKSHTLLLPKKTEHAPHTQYIYNGEGSTLGEKTNTSHGVYDQDDEEEYVFDGWLTDFDLSQESKDHVVRFLAYFIEEVPESSTETTRLRKVCIRYHIYDNSISIIEAKQDNSGIVQSVLLSRRQVPRRMDDVKEIVLLQDFRLGHSINLFSREYHILDMDARSRLYYKKFLGESVPQGLPWPIEKDKFTATMEARRLKTAHRLATSDDMDRKRNIEQQLTGIYTKHPTEDIISAKKFLKNKINEHLTFLALWDDRENLSGDLRFCAIRFYLDSEAIEILEAKPENSGRVGGPILLSRQRVPRAGVDIGKTRFQEHTFGVIMKRDYLVAEDFRIGETYTIYGRPYYVYDASPLTREYMSEELGVDLDSAIDIKPFVSVDSKGSVKFFPPPPNGFGSEREKRVNWVTISAQREAPNLKKLEKEEKKVMRFLAVLANPLVVGDEKREFVISFFRATDEIEIFEKPARNSGFIAGRFLSKGIYLKQLSDGSSVPYQPEDFEVGKEIIVLERPFKLLAMDEETRRILEEVEDMTTETRLKELILLFKQQIQLKFLHVYEAFCTLSSNGVLGYRQVRDFLRSCSCSITEEEALLLLQNIAPSSNGVISYDQFLKLMNINSSGHMDEASLTSRSVKNVNMVKDDSFKVTATKAEDFNRRKQLTIELRHKLIQRRGTTQDQFRLLACHNPTSRLNRDVFRKSLNDILHFNVSKKDEDMLISILFDGREDENGDITYKQFQEFTDLGDLM